VFRPFVATLVCAHDIVRHGGSEILARTELSSPKTFRRTLGATAIAVPPIVGVDPATGGVLFLHPRFPESQLLITPVLVAVLLTFSVGRSLAALARRTKRVA
jgi:hypothetical protein